MGTNWSEAAPRNNEQSLNKHKSEMYTCSSLHSESKITKFRLFKNIFNHLWTPISKFSGLLQPVLKPGSKPVPSHLNENLLWNTMIGCRFAW